MSLLEHLTLWGGRWWGLSRVSWARSLKHTFTFFTQISFLLLESPPWYMVLLPGLLRIKLKNDLPHGSCLVLRWVFCTIPEQKVRFFCLCDPGAYPHTWRLSSPCLPGRLKDRVHSSREHSRSLPTIPKLVFSCLEMCSLCSRGCPEILGSNDPPSPATWVLRLKGAPDCPWLYPCL